MIASSKKISLNSLFPAMLGIGRTVMPGVRMSTRNIEMPCCFFTSGSVRASSRHWSAGALA